MSIQSSVELGKRLQSAPKFLLYLILLVACTLPLLFPFKVPDKPDESTIAFYAQLMSLPEGSKVLIGSDWTKNTRGESGPQFIALVKILMRRKIKFAVYSTGDAQSPEVARNAIAEASREEGGGQPLYRPFRDYVVLGFYPNSEGENTTINGNVLAAFKGRQDVSDTGPRDVLTSPVFDGIKTLSDFKLLVLVTPSSTSDVTIERIKNTPLMFMVTGVMVPATTNYYSSGLLVGLCGGSRGAYDLETLMEYGVNNAGPNEITSDTIREKIPGFPGMKNEGAGTRYYPTLHIALGLLILVVIIGNVGMLLERRGAK